MGGNWHQECKATGGEPRVAWFNWCMKCMKPMKDLQATGPVREGLEYQGKQRRCVCLCACVYMKERKRDTTLYPMLYPSIIQSSIYLLWFSCQVMSDSCNTMDCGPPAVEGVTAALRSSPAGALLLSSGSSAPVFSCTLYRRYLM